MPTFEQLLTARLGPLDTAVTQWTAMIGKLTPSPERRQRDEGQGGQVHLEG
ncbi:hypothetical protein ACIBUR_28380 [Streptomyces anulatus]